MAWPGSLTPAQVEDPTAAPVLGPSALPLSVLPWEAPSCPLPPSPQTTLSPEGSLSRPLGPLAPTSGGLLVTLKSGFGGLVPASQSIAGLQLQAEEQGRGSS